MRAAFYLSPVLLVCFVLACSAIVNVAVDANEDFSAYQTWDWLAEPAPASGDAPSSPPALVALVAYHIERTLYAQGLRRSSRGADFFVSYDLAIQRRATRIQQPFAPQLVDSYNSSASYWVEGTNTVTRMMNDLSLVIRIRDAHGRVTWSGSLAQSVEEGTRLPVDTAVEKLLVRFTGIRREK